MTVRVYGDVKKLPMVNGRWSLVIFGGAFGAASLRKQDARSATADDK
jgi:hypothetical protein